MSATAAEFAPIYFFDDQAAFDSDVVDQAMTRVLSGPIRLPHPAVIFELREQRSARCDHVDDAFQGVGIQRHTARQQVGHEFQAQHHERHHHAEGRDADQ